MVKLSIKIAKCYVNSVIGLNLENKMMGDNFVDSGRGSPRFGEADQNDEN